MVSLSQMARLVEAVRPDARLVLVGDPQQLASVEAGAVLGDIVGPAADRLLMRPPPVPPWPRPPACRSTTSRRSRRPRPPRSATASSSSGGSTASAAGSPPWPRRSAAGDADATIAALSAGNDDVSLDPVDLAEPTAAALGPVREAAVAAGVGHRRSRPGRRRPRRRSRRWPGSGCCAPTGGGRTAWRRGARRSRRWLAAAVPGFAAGGAWYVGRPLLVTENDYTLGLYNGDTGVVVAAGGDRRAAVFERRGELLEFSPARLSAVETVHAMTVHKSQGSQFDTVAVLLPDPDSPILTRELLYTAVTRARRRLLLAGTEEAIRAAVTRPVARSSGLRRWLWG